MAARIEEIEKADLQHTRMFSAREVIEKLKDRMAQHDTTIRKTFLRYSKSGRGYVTKKDFRKVRSSTSVILGPGPQSKILQGGTKWSVWVPRLVENFSKIKVQFALNLHVLKLESNGQNLRP